MYTSHDIAVEKSFQGILYKRNGRTTGMMATIVAPHNDNASHDGRPSIGIFLCIFFL